MSHPPTLYPNKLLSATAHARAQKVAGMVRQWEAASASSAPRTALVFGLLVQEGAQR